MSDRFNKSQILAIESSDRKYVRAKKIYIDMINNLQAGMVLSEVVYWHLPGKTGKSRLLLKNGEQWLATRRKSWWDRSRLTEREFDRALEKLVKAKLIIREYFVYNDQMTPHLRINWPVFEERYNQLMGNTPTKATKRRIILKGIPDIWDFILNIIGYTPNQLVTPNEVSPIGYTPSPIGYSVSPDGKTVILFGDAYTTYTTNTIQVPQDNTHTPAPNGLGSASAPSAGPVGLKAFYSTLEEKMAATAIEEKSPATAEVAIPLTPSSALPPSPPETLNMNHLRDVVANKWFDFNSPKYATNAPAKTLKRIDDIVSIIITTFSNATDDRFAWAALEFCKHWATKKDRAGNKLAMPMYTDSFGTHWRKWLNEHPEIEACIQPKVITVEIDDEPTKPVENPVFIGGTNVNAA